MICVRDIQNEVIRFIDKGQNLYKNLLILTLIEKSNYVILNITRTYIWYQQTILFIPKRAQNICVYD